MRDVIRITFNRAIQFGAADLIVAPCQLKDRAFAMSDTVAFRARTREHVREEIFIFKRISRNRRISRFLLLQLAVVMQEKSNPRGVRFSRKMKMKI